MRKFLGNYKKEYTEAFRESIEILEGKDKTVIESKIDEVLNDPWHNSRNMKGRRRGLRRRWLNDSDRIIFAVCEDCRENGYERFNRCSDCDEAPDNLVIFVELVLDHEY